MFTRVSKTPSARLLTGTSGVRGLSLRPIMQQRCGDGVISLNRLPGKAKGSPPGPRVSTRVEKKNPKHPCPPQITTQIKKTLMTSPSPHFNKKTTHSTGLCGAGSSFSSLLSFTIKVIKPQKAKLNNEQGWEI